MVLFSLIPAACIMYKSEFTRFPMAVEVVNYRSGLENEPVDCWNRYLRHDPISITVFERKVLLDPNFDDEGLR